MMTPEHDHSPSNTPPITRRRFIAGAVSSVLAFSVLNAELIRGAEANSKINLGLIGCGNRGKWIAGLFQKHGGYNFFPVADSFQHHVGAPACSKKPAATTSAPSGTTSGTTWTRRERSSTCRPPTAIPGFPATGGCW